MTANGIHVIRDGDRWWVLREGESGVPSSTFLDARDAIRTGRALARRERTEFTLYDEQGRVRAWNDFRQAG
ncbi:MAG TPA: DUF2188 domain-containing protein [Thermoanaerobaculia bacterium]|nr:DUF2188 domain-containing protein [Thermoanaerobaculia bacterium]